VGLNEGQSEERLRVPRSEVVDKEAAANQIPSLGLDLKAKAKEDNGLSFYCLFTFFTSNPM